MIERDAMKSMADGLRQFVDELREAFAAPPETPENPPARTETVRELHILCAANSTDLLKFGQGEDGTVIAHIEDGDGPTSEIVLTIRKVDRLIGWLTDARTRMVDKGDDGAEVV